MEEHEEVSSDPFAELCDTTQADQEDDLEEDIKKELLAWKRSKEVIRLLCLKLIALFLHTSKCNVAIIALTNVILR